MSDQRYCLVLGKFQVRAIESGLTGFRAQIDLTQGVTMWIDSPVKADVRVGDLLTFYTEVLAHENAGLGPN